jgi:DNA-binding response OmpR family regulator
VTPDAVGGAKSLGGGRILVVDDEPAIRFVYQEFLEDRGMPVSLAEDGQSALAIMQALPHSAALVDLTLPGMSGLELIGELRRSWPELPIIVISATPRESCLVQLEMLRVDSFLEKPVDLLELAALLGRLAA